MKTNVFVVAVIAVASHVKAIKLESASKATADLLEAARELKMV